MVFRRKLGLKEDFNNTGDGQIRAPGFHYAVDFQLNRTKRFGHGVNDFKQSPRLTAREVAMLGVMNALTDKPSWEEKVLDDDIVTKWGEEARRIPLMSQKAWEWCVLELRDKARRFQKKGRVLVLDAASRISKSDTTVSETLHRELRDAVQPLLEQPDDGKDWHPGSEGQVLDLVHPSLFPLVFGRTRVLMDGGTVPLDLSNTDLFDTGKIAPQQSSAAGRASRRFQWLPCEVHFKEDTRTDVEITSYINNLHPSNKKAYAAIEKIISLAIPAWNEVLVHGRDGRTPPRIRTYGAQFAEALPEWYGDLWAAEQNRERNPDAYKEARRKVAEYCGFEDRDEEQETDDEDVDIEDEAMSVDEDEIGPEYVEESGLSAAVEAYYLRHVRQVVHPEPGQSFTYRQWKAGLTGKGVVPRSCSPCSSSSDEEDSDEEDSRHDENYYSLRLQDDFREQGLQVVVKLASIELTPEKPEYAGGSWHVEGFLNEHIVATALYYYEVENVTEARISFRTEAGLDQEEMQYDQDDHKPLAEIFGVRSGRLRYEAAIQDLGSVTTPQGRLLTFPNTLQHRVEPFELADKSRPGHRRFLALWLVDPHYRICSTRNVPPQQEAWWAESGQLAAASTEGRLMSLEEAKQLRLVLMAERTWAAQAVERGLETYNFCEH